MAGNEANCALMNLFAVCVMAWAHRASGQLDLPIHSYPSPRDNYLAANGHNGQNQGRYDGDPYFRQNDINADPFLPPRQLPQYAAPLPPPPNAFDYSANALNPYPPQIRPGQFPLQDALPPPRPFRPYDGVTFPNNFGPGHDGGVLFPDPNAPPTAGMPPSPMSVPTMPMTPGMEAMPPTDALSPYAYPQRTPVFQMSDTTPTTPAPAVQKVVLNIGSLRNRARNADRRMLLPPFSRIMMAMIAPRMLRFQFDMMVQAIVAEVVRKVIFPLIGVVARGAGGGQSPPPPDSSNEIDEEDPDVEPPPVRVVQVPSGNAGPATFVVQSPVQGAPVVTAQPAGASPGQLSFVLTASDPNGQIAPQQFVIQLQTSSAGTPATTTSTPMTAAVIPVSVTGTTPQVAQPAVQKFTIPLSMLQQLTPTQTPQTQAIQSQAIQVVPVTADSVTQAAVDERQQQASSIHEQKAAQEFDHGYVSDEDPSSSDFPIADFENSNYGNFEHFQRSDLDRRDDKKKARNARSKRRGKKRTSSVGDDETVNVRETDEERASRWNAVLQNMSNGHTDTKSGNIAKKTV